MKESLFLKDFDTGSHLTQPYKKFYPVTLITVIVFLCTPLGVQAGRTLDQIYATRLIVPLVVNHSEFPVYGEYVENELLKGLASRPQFEVSEKGSTIAKTELKKIGEIESLGGFEQKNIKTKDNKEDKKKKKQAELKLGPVSPILEALSALGIDAIILAEVKDTYQALRINLHLVAVRTHERLHSSSKAVADRFSLESISQAAKEALNDLLANIPFDATIVRREGYRVLVDRGAPIKNGETLPTFTFVMSRDGLILQETGTIEITQVEDNFSFGRVLVEKKPFEVIEGNKVRIPSLHRILDSLADNKEEEELETLKPRRSLGFVNLDVGANLVTVNSLTAAGVGASSSNIVYPGGNLIGQLWITQNFFFDADIQMGLSVINSTGTGSQTNLNSVILGFRGLFGYRLPFDQSALAPTAAVKVGFARRQFKIDASSDPLSFVTTTYSGLLVGGEINFPLGERWTISFGINTLVLNSVSEDPVDSGAVTGGSNFDLQLAARYRFSDRIDLLTKIQLIHNSASFDGQGTRPVAIASSTQTSRAIFGGLAYFF